MKKILRAFLGFTLVLGLTLAPWMMPSATAEDTIKIAFIGPFSGAFAPQGDAFLKELRYSMDVVNKTGGALGKQFEIVTFDDKLQPAEAIIALKSVTDQNIPIVIQCIGSNVAAAMIDGVAKYNARNPENRVLYLNCAALANELTNEKCDFWHFRFAANVGPAGGNVDPGAAAGHDDGLLDQPGLSLWPVRRSGHEVVPRKAAAGCADCRR